jgi:hypothetical protein
LARDLQDRRYGLTPSLRKSPFLGPAFAQLDDTRKTAGCHLGKNATDLAETKMRQKPFASKQRARAADPASPRGQLSEKT